MVSFVSPAWGCGGNGVLVSGVLLQAVSHSPTSKVDIHIRYLILFLGILKRKNGLDYPHNDVITVSNIRFRQSGVKPDP